MQRGNQLLARDMALAELDAHAEGIVLRLKIEDERLGPRSASGLLTAFAASFVPREPALADALHGLQHLFLAGLASHLQQQRFGDNSLLEAALAHWVGDVAQRQALGDRRAGLADFSRDVVVGIVKLCRQPVQSFGLLERGKVLALKVFDQSQLQGFGIVGNLFDAGQFAQAGGAGSVVAALAGDNEVAILARDEADQQRLQHPFLLDGVTQFAQVAQDLSRLIRIRPDFIDRDHTTHRGAAIAGERLYVVGVMPHLQCDGQSDPLRHVG